jgi:hypothetical protein
MKEPVHPGRRRRPYEPEPVTRDVSTPGFVTVFWNGFPLRTHPNREAAQADLDDCLRRRTADVKRALVSSTDEQAGHIGSFTLGEPPELVRRT